MDIFHEGLAHLAELLDTTPDAIKGAIVSTGFWLALMIGRRVWNWIRAEAPLLSDIAKQVTKWLNDVEGWDERTISRGGAGHAVTSERRLTCRSVPCQIATDWSGFSVYVNGLDITSRLSEREQRLIWSRAQEVLAYKARRADSEEHAQILRSLEPVTVVEIHGDECETPGGGMIAAAVDAVHAQAVPEDVLEELRRQRCPPKSGGLGRVPLPAKAACR
jgi:hypothetical protein